MRSGVAFGMGSIRRFLLAFVFCCFCAASLALAAPEKAHANGKPAVTSEDEASAENKARQEAQAAEKAAREKREAEARRQAAAKRAAAKKAAEAKAAQAAIKAASDDLAAANAWMQGREMIEEGRFRRAAEYLQRYVRGNPRSADAWYWLSRAHHALGDYDRAQRAASIALEIDAYYPALTKTPSGMQPLPKPTKESKKEPRPSMSVMPVKPPVPSALALEPTTLSFPYLEPHSGDRALSGDVGGRMELLDSSRVPAEGEPAYQEAHLRYEAYPPLPQGRTPAWMQREAFREISRWRFRVDRMAIVKAPRVAIAWKGDYPHEVYFWTGSEWARIQTENNPPMASKTEKIDEILLRVKDDLEEVLAQNAYAWREADTPALASNAAQMRYWWQGEVDLSDARREREEAEVRREKAEKEMMAEEDARRSAGK